MDDPDRDRGHDPRGIPRRPVWFVGDLDDPWVAAIAGSLPAGTERIACPGDLPASIAEPATAPAVLVLHRAVLTRHDADRLTRLRSGRTPPTRVVLCHGPHVRYADLERWADLFDTAVSEATARDTLARRVLPGFDPSDPSDPTGPAVARRMAAGARPRVAVISGNAALRQTLAEACEAAGYPVAAARDWSELPPAGPAVWDVPLLEPDWSYVLSRRGGAGPVVALIGFADRRSVTEARDRGAAACLELPLDLPDLVAVLDRLTAPRREPEPAHDVPPPPSARRKPAGALAGEGRGA